MYAPAFFIWYTYYLVRTWVSEVLPTHAVRG